MVWGLDFVQISLEAPPHNLWGFLKPSSGFEIMYGIHKSFLSDLIYCHHYQFCLPYVLMMNCLLMHEILLCAVIFFTTNCEAAGVVVTNIIWLQGFWGIFCVAFIVENQFICFMICFKSGFTFVVLRVCLFLNHLQFFYSLNHFIWVVLFNGYVKTILETISILHDVKFGSQ